MTPKHAETMGHFVRLDIDTYVVYPGPLPTGKESWGDRLGEVTKVWFESHIRRGRMQASPWWRAVRADGVAVVVKGRDAWQTRREAGEALLWDLQS